MASRVSIKVKLTGHKEIDRALRSLPRAGARRAITAGMKAGMKPVEAEAVRLAPRDTGATAGSIATKKARVRRGYGVDLVAHDGSREGAIAAASVEYGTKDRATSDGAARGRVKARRWLRRAFERSRDAARRAADSEIARQVDRELKALARGHKSAAGMDRAGRAASRRRARAVKSLKRAASKRLKSAGKGLKKARKSAGKRAKAAKKRIRKATRRRRR